MTPETLASLINLGAAGAVIIVVRMFLKSNEKRDKEWRDFFTLLNKANCADVAKNYTILEKLVVTDRRF